MKKLMLLVVLVLFAVSCSNDSTSPSQQDEYKMMTEVKPQYLYKLDIKTKFSQKLDITGSKNGLIAYLKSSVCDWAEVVEVGEYYSVWIKNLTRTIDGSVVNLKYDLEIHKPAMITEGELLLSRKMNITYDYNADWIGQTGFANESEVADYMKKYYTKMKIANTLKPVVNNLLAATGGVNLIINKIFAKLSFDTSEEKTKDKTAEAIIAGAELYANLQEMIVELER